MTEAVAYEVAIYEAAGAATASPTEKPVRRVDLPAGVGTWTPELPECLAPGRYGWAVAALLDNEERRWSKPAVFRVEDPGARRPREFPTSEQGVIVTDSRVVAGWAAEGDGSAVRHLPGAALFTPPACVAGSKMFVDVAAGSPYCRWIEQAARYDIMQGCGGGRYCPTQPVTREQLAMFLVRATRGTLTFAPAPGGPRTTTVNDPFLPDVRYTSLAIGVDGLPIISYHDTANDLLKVVHCRDAACAGPVQDFDVVDGPPGILVGEYVSIAIGADDLPIMSYYDATADALKVAHCENPACNGFGTKTITTVDDPTNNVGLYTSIAIGGDGLPVISYHDETDGNLKVAHCNDVACADQNESVVTVDNSGNDVGAHSSIAIGEDGLPIISYHDATAGDLKVAHCNNPVCSGATITTVDPAGGAFTSIAIGADGLAVVSYTASDHIRVAHCNDVACAGMNETITTVDNASFVGVYNSIAIGTDGFPVISYENQARGDLKVAHCNDVACAGVDETIVTLDDEGGIFTSIAIGADGVPVISYTGGSAEP